jgi:hypothetical protein
MHTSIYTGPRLKHKTIKAWFSYIPIAQPAPLSNVNSHCHWCIKFFKYQDFCGSSLEWILFHGYCRWKLSSGNSVAKWLAHLPFTSKVASSDLIENFLNATRTQSSCEKSKSQRSAESRGFSLGTPVPSHRESWQGGLGKRAHSNRHMLCCGDPAPVSKAKKPKYYTLNVCTRGK